MRKPLFWFPTTRPAALTGRLRAPAKRERGARCVDWPLIFTQAVRRFFWLFFSSPPCVAAKGRPAALLTHPGMREAPLMPALTHDGVFSFPPITTSKPRLHHAHERISFCFALSGCLRFQPRLARLHAG